MKRITNQWMVAAVGMVAAMALGQPQATWAGSTNTWKFVTNASQVSSDGAGTATAAPAQFSAGWLDKDAILGKAKGVWDLGQNGSITLDNLSGLLGDPGLTRTFTVSVVQFKSHMYGDLATVSIAGAQCVHTNQLAVVIPELASASSIGDWVVNETQWSVPAGVSVNKAVITSAYYGSLINQVSLVSSAAIISQPAPQLAIHWLGSGHQQVQISWPASTTSQLQSTADLNNPQWSDVSVTPLVNGNTSSVTIDATDAMQFYRLKP
jgi:hypothetical protein